jgi:hypothetical protein
LHPLGRAAAKARMYLRFRAEYRARAGSVRAGNCASSWVRLLDNRLRRHRVRSFQFAPVVIPLCRSITAHRQPSPPCRTPRKRSRESGNSDTHQFFTGPDGASRRQPAFMPMPDPKTLPRKRLFGHTTRRGLAGARARTESSKALLRPLTGTSGVVQPGRVLAATYSSL